VRAPAVQRDSRGRAPLTTADLLLGAVALLAVVPACTSPSNPTEVSTTTTSAPSSVPFQQGSSAEVADCEADAKSLEVALGAYMAEKGAYPSPPSAWSAAAYVADFQPLTSAGGGGPYLPVPPSTNFYVIEYDSSGHVWIAPPGSYHAAYDPGQSFDANPNVCLAAVG
jgi:hypothetical protein